METKYTKEQIAALEAIKIATGKKPGVFCPVCEAKILERWSPAKIFAHIVSHEESR